MGENNNLFNNEDSKFEQLKESLIQLLFELHIKLAEKKTSLI